MGVAGVEVIATISGVGAGICLDLLLLSVSTVLFVARSFDRALVTAMPDVRAKRRIVQLELH